MMWPAKLPTVRTQGKARGPSFQIQTESIKDGQKQILLRMTVWGFHSIGRMPLKGKGMEKGPFATGTLATSVSFLGGGNAQ